MTSSARLRLRPEESLPRGKRSKQRGHRSGSLSLALEVYQSYTSYPPFGPYVQCTLSCSRFFFLSLAYPEDASLVPGRLLEQRVCHCHRSGLEAYPGPQQRCQLACARHSCNILRRIMTCHRYRDNFFRLVLPFVKCALLGDERAFQWHSLCVALRCIHICRPTLPSTEPSSHPPCSSAPPSCRTGSSEPLASWWQTRSLHLLCHPLVAHCHVI